MREYEEKIEALKKKIRDKILVYKATCRMRLEKSNFKDEEYIVEYHYLIVLEKYINSPGAFNEAIGTQIRRLDNNVLNKLLANKYDVVWNYIQYMKFRYTCIDMINLFNHELFTIKDMSNAPKGIISKN